MRLTLAFLLCSSVATVLAGPLELIPQACLNCICAASSGCQPSRCEYPSKGHEQKAFCGPYQLSRNYWEIGGSIGYDFETCANMKTCSERVMLNYMKTNAHDCNRDGEINCLDFAAIHFAGPDQCSEPFVYASDFWEAFQETLCYQDLTAPRAIVQQAQQQQMFQQQEYQQEEQAPAEFQQQETYIQEPLPVQQLPVVVPRKVVRTVQKTVVQQEQVRTAPRKGYARKLVPAERKLTFTSPKTRFVQQEPQFQQEEQVEAKAVQQEEQQQVVQEQQQQVVQQEQVASRKGYARKMVPAALKSTFSSPKTRFVQQEEQQQQQPQEIVVEPKFVQLPVQQEEQQQIVQERKLPVAERKAVSRRISQEVSRKGYARKMVPAERKLAFSSPKTRFAQQEEQPQFQQEEQVEAKAVQQEEQQQVVQEEQQQQVVQQEQVASRKGYARKIVPAERKLTFSSPKTRFVQQEEQPQFQQEEQVEARAVQQEEQQQVVQEEQQQQVVQQEQVASRKGYARKMVPAALKSTFTSPKTRFVQQEPQVQQEEQVEAKAVQQAEQQAFQQEEQLPVQQEQSQLPVSRRVVHVAPRKGYARKLVPAERKLTFSSPKTRFVQQPSQVPQQAEEQQVVQEEQQQVVQQEQQQQVQQEEQVASRKGYARKINVKGRSFSGLKGAVKGLPQEPKGRTLPTKGRNVPVKGRTLPAKGGFGQQMDLSMERKLPVNPERKLVVTQRPQIRYLPPKTIGSQKY